LASPVELSDKQHVNKKLDGMIGEEFPVRFCFQGHGAYFDFQKVYSF